MEQTSTGKPTFFYHNFPRKAKNDTAHGLDVLRLMLRTGLLLVPELTKLRAPGGGVVQEIVQQRMCFTELASDEVAKHAETFGVFALEYEPIVFRQLGAVPVFYIPSNLNGAGLAAGGTVLASRVAYTQELIRRLIGDRKTGGAGKAEFYASLIDNLVSLEELFYTAEAIQNLFYPTEDLNYHDDPLHYYRQREWKIIPNFARDGKWEIEEPTAEEKRSLVSLNAFFGKELRPGTSRVEGCRYFRRLDGKPTLGLARRIIAPDAAVEGAETLVREARMDIVVAPLSSLVGGK